MKKIISAVLIVALLFSCVATASANSFCYQNHGSGPQWVVDSQSAKSYTSINGTQHTVSYKVFYICSYCQAVGKMNNNAETVAYTEGHSMVKTNVDLGHVTNTQNHLWQAVCSACKYIGTVIRYCTSCPSINNVLPVVK